MKYEDNPEANLVWLRSLSSSELKMYVQGYLMACAHIRESFSRGKYEMLNTLLRVKSDHTKTKLSRGIDILDSYETIIKKKEAKLLELFPEFKNEREK